MVEVWCKLRAGGCIGLERIAQPEAAQPALIHRLNWPLPQQPPPKILQDRSSKCVDNLSPFFLGAPEGRRIRIRGKCESRLPLNYRNLSLISSLQSGLCALSTRRSTGRWCRTRHRSDGKESIPLFGGQLPVHEPSHFRVRSDQLLNLFRTGSHDPVRKKLLLIVLKYA
jgi:hypothetical protein